VAATRWAWAEIDLAAIAANVRALKALTPDSTLFMAVVKSDGYGHGAVQVARAALAAGADRLGVATVDEALALRGAGIDAPLHILSEPPASAIDLLLEHDVIPTVTSREFALALGSSAASRGIEARYHLKVDTGMNRIGVRAEDAAEFSARLADVSGLALEGTFTHFATADVLGDWDFDRQLARFGEAVEMMKTEGVAPGIVHAANSPATILHPESHFDMVRCGIAIYGLHPAASTRGAVVLRPAMSVKARVLLAKRIGMGEGVSYGLTYRAAAPTVIATLPLGYADGVHRVLSNSMAALIGGERVAQVGRVCMDQLMVEVPPKIDVRAGDEAVIVGVQGDQQIEMDELADLAGTINYEMACAFGMRLPRVYS
jgi:alanine racemase